MEPELQAACLRAAVYLYCLLPPSSWYESLDTTITVFTLVSPIIQVLHLMNKMNLPCPFGPVTARPPMVSLYTVLLHEEEQANGPNSTLFEGKQCHYREACIQMCQRRYVVYEEGT